MAIKIGDASAEQDFIAKEIYGFKGYYITSDGRVWGKRKGGFLKPSVANGYHRVSLSRNGIVVNKLVHRLVAEAFIENPLCKKEVNHIDENKTNNNVTNLEWCTRLENVRHGTGIQRRTKTQINRKDCSKAVVQMDKNNNIINVFASAKEAWRETGVNRSHICEVCNCKPKYNTAGGYKWKWAERGN